MLLCFPRRRLAAPGTRPGDGVRFGLLRACTARVCTREHVGGWARWAFAIRKVDIVQAGSRLAVQYHHCKNVCSAECRSGTQVMRWVRGNGCERGMHMRLLQFRAT